MGLRGDTIKNCPDPCIVLAKAQQNDKQGGILGADILLAGCSSGKHSPSTPLLASNIDVRIAVVC